MNILSVGGEKSISRESHLMQCDTKGDIPPASYPITAIRLNTIKKGLVNETGYSKPVLSGIYFTLFHISLY